MTVLLNIFSTDASSAKHIDIETDFIDFIEFGITKFYKKAGSEHSVRT